MPHERLERWFSRVVSGYRYLNGNFYENLVNVNGFSTLSWIPRTTKDLRETLELSWWYKKLITYWKRLEHMRSDSTDNCSHLAFTWKHFQRSSFVGRLNFLLAPLTIIEGFSFLSVSPIWVLSSDSLESSSDKLFKHLCISIFVFICFNCYAF